MAGVAQFLNHGLELAVTPGFWFLQLFQLVRFLFKVPGSNDADVITLGRFLVKFFQPVFVEIHLPCARDNIHNRFSRFNLGAEFLNLKFCVTASTGRYQR